MKLGRVALVPYLLLAASAVSGQSPFEPSWAHVPPAQVLSFEASAGASSVQNGSALRLAILSLQPGQRLEIGSGVYTLTSPIHAQLYGEPFAPIWIVAKPGAKPVLLRTDASQNVLDVWGRYLCIRGLELTGGSMGMRLHSTSEVWVDQCHVHHTAEASLTANTADADRLFITRNDLHHTGGTGEGMYLGVQDGSKAVSRSVIALNHVWATGGSQGDGIELKQGSWGNWIASNYVHDTLYPCILVYGTGGKQRNVVEGNLLHGSFEAVLQVQGEALVVNNLIAGGKIGFESHYHMAAPQNLTFVHNTVINASHAVSVSSWAGKPGMIFANNVAYTAFGTAIGFNGGSTGVTVAGNVAGGPVFGTSSGVVYGGGFQDLLGVAWFGVGLVFPSTSGPIIGSASPAFATPVDLIGIPRTAPVEAGCLEAW